MGNLAMFVPLAKADAAQRLVFGYIDETPDRAGEIMDYASSKPNFEAWSETFSKATDGKSAGNLRAQHGKTAAGKFEKIDFDDTNKRIELCAHVVDDAEWKKVEQGVYTGFSPGGRYAKRWRDGAHTRYTALPSEISLVDLPCIPSAAFTMVKADGVEEQVEFVLDKAYEPGNEATKARAEEMAKADGGNWKDHVQKARADLIGENAAAALAKMAGDPDTAPAAATDDLLGSLNAALKKADTALVADGSGEITAVSIYASALGDTLLKSDSIELPVAPPSHEAVALIGADLAKSLVALDLIRTAATPILEKGLYEVADVVKTLQSMSWITAAVTEEAGWERDNSPLPQMAVDLVKALKSFLVAMIEEEVAELLERTKASAGEYVEIVLTDDADEDMQLAARIVDLVKADAGRMEKAGARNSKGDAARIQAIHDKAGELGASCGMKKADELAAENDRLAKAVETTIPRIESLVEEIATMRGERDADRAEMAKMAEQIEKLGGQPALTKIEAAALKTKEEDNLTKSDGDAPKSEIEAARDLPPAERARRLEAIALRARHQS